MDVSKLSPVILGSRPFPLQFRNFNFFWWIFEHDADFRDVHLVEKILDALLSESAELLKLAFEVSLLLLVLRF